MRKASMWRWGRLHILRFLIAIGAATGAIVLTMLIGFGVICVLDMFIKFRKIGPSYFVVSYVAFAFCAGCLAIYAWRCIQTQLGVYWGLYCDICKKNFTWHQYVVNCEKGYCLLCQNREQVALEPEILPPGVPSDEIVGLDNPYAAPSVASYSETAKLVSDGFIEPVLPSKVHNAWGGQAISLALMPLLGGLLIVVSPLVLMVLLCGVLNSRLGFLRVPVWLQHEIQIKRWRDFKGLLFFYAYILLAATACYYVATYFSVVNNSWQDFLFISTIVCTLLLYWQIFKQWRASKLKTPLSPTPLLNPLGNYLVPQDECEQYRLMLHWDTKVEPLTPVRLKFRTVTEQGLVLHVYDQVLKEVIHKQVFPAANLQDWNELTLALNAPPVGDFSLERLYFVFDSLDRQPWIIPLSGATASEEWKAEQEVTS